MQNSMLNIQQLPVTLSAGGENPTLVLQVGISNYSRKYFNHYFGLKDFVSGGSRFEP
jgi:outer membrane scaffolding protein for murein synthesis (MipA/OmpV family)